VRLLGMTLSSSGTQVAVEIVPVVGHRDGVLRGAVATQVEATGALAFTTQQQQQQVLKVS